MGLSTTIYGFGLENSDIMYKIVKPTISCRHSVNVSESGCIFLKKQVV